MQADRIVLSRARGHDRRGSAAAGTSGDGGESRQTWDARTRCSRPPWRSRETAAAGPAAARPPRRAARDPRAREGVPDRSPPASSAASERMAWRIAASCGTCLISSPENRRSRDLRCHRQSSRGLRDKSLRRSSAARGASGRIIAELSVRMLPGQRQIARRSPPAVAGTPGVQVHDSHAARPRASSVQISG